MLKISNLRFGYGGESVIGGVNLVLNEPEVVAIIGDNGTGKTTLLKLIAGEFRPDDGVIEVDGKIGYLEQTQEDLVDKSGGERTKIRLEELMKQKHEILLLDEPTNNLDAENKAWLVNELSWYYGIILVVSHDRDFINQVAKKVLYVHDGEAELFSGNYADFLERQKQTAHEQLLQYEKTQVQKRKLQAQLQIAKSKAHKSNRRSYDKLRDESKLRANGKRMAAQNSAGKILRATESKMTQLKAVTKPHERKIYAANLQSELTHDKRLLRAAELKKRFGEKILFENLNFEVRTGERIRVIGRNGSGKSTLFKIIMGDMLPDAGEVKLAYGLKLGYISQEMLGFDLRRSFLEQNSGIAKTEIYQAGVTMDFLPADLERPTGELSRGQITKLAILKLILEPLDLVILDEITNHLDIRAQENIESALQNYGGAILMATHNETFARKVGYTRAIQLG